MPYAATLSPSLGVAPYTFSVAQGALPPGLALDASGTISGTTTAMGEHGFWVALGDGVRDLVLAESAAP